MLPRCAHSAGTPEELKTEMERMTTIYKKIKSTPDPFPAPPKGSDPVFDLLKALEARRLDALEWHIKRIAGMLNVHAEL
jgi:hypothetical protein